MPNTVLNRDDLDRIATRGFQITGFKIREIWCEDASHPLPCLADAVQADLKMRLEALDLDIRRKAVAKRRWQLPFSARQREAKERLEQFEAEAVSLQEALDWLSDHVGSDPQPVIELLATHMPRMTVHLIPESFEIEGEVLPIGTQIHSASFARFGHPQLTTYTVASHQPYYREDHPKVMRHGLVGPNGRDPGFFLSSASVPLLREGGHEIGASSKRPSWLDEKAARAAAVAWCRHQIAESEKVIGIYEDPAPVPQNIDEKVGNPESDLVT